MKRIRLALSSLLVIAITAGCSSGSGYSYHSGSVHHYHTPVVVHHYHAPVVVHHYHAPVVVHHYSTPRKTVVLRKSGKH